MSKFYINATSPSFGGVVFEIAEYETMEEAKKAFAIIKAQQKENPPFEVTEETETFIKVEGMGLCVRWYISRKSKRQTDME